MRGKSRFKIKLAAARLFAKLQMICN